MRDYKLSIILVTLYLLAFGVAGRLGAPLSLMFLMFSLSPILIIWMVYTVIRYGKYTGKELKPNEEWGYEDTPKDQLGTFLRL